MTVMENENGTLTDLSSQAESKEGGAAISAELAKTDGIINESECCVESEDTQAEETDGGEEGNDGIGTDTDATAEFDEDKQKDRACRAEYERLIRTRFKEFYTDDTQKMINKRFKRYKAMEERLIELESRAEQMYRRERELEQTIAAECERVERETEQRVIAGITASRSRPHENGYAPKRAPMPPDVASLTKSQRAEIAKRAFGGEKISF